MSQASLPGSVAITFAADRSQIDAYLAELRRGLTVPIQFQPAGGGQYQPASSGYLAAVGGPPGQGGASGDWRDAFAQIRQQTQTAVQHQGRTALQREKRVDDAWDRAALAQQRAAEREEAAANRRSQQTQTRETRDRDQRQRRVEENWDRAAFAQQKAAEREEADAQKPSGRIFGLRAGRLLQYASAGFLLREGLAAGQDFANAYIQQQLAVTPLAKVQSQMGLANAIGNIPLVGQAASLFLTPQRLQAEQAVQGAEEGLKDVAHRNVLDAASRRRRDEVYATDASLAKYQYAASFQRREVDIYARSAVERRNFQRGQQDLFEQIQSEQDPYQRARLTLDYNRAAKEQPEIEAARKRRDDAELKELQRDERLIRHREALHGPALAAAAEGRFGVAGEREFEAGLLTNEQDADQISPLLGKLVRNFNILRRGGRQAGIDIDVQRLSGQTAAINAIISRDPLSSQLLDIQAERDYRLHFARNPEEERSIRENSNAREREATQRRSDEMQSARFGLRSAAETLGIDLNAPGTPATRERLGEINRLFRGTQGQELAALQAGRGELVPDIAKLGILQLQGYQQQFLTGLRPEEVSINRTALSGPGTEDPGAVMKQIAADIADLKKIPTKLDALLNALGNLVASD